MFPAFICANNIESLVHNLFCVKIFNPAPVIFLFRDFNFILSGIVSSGSDFTSTSPSSAVNYVHLHLNINQQVSFQGYFELLSFSSDVL